LGELHYGRRKSQPAATVVREFYRTAEPKLKFAVLRFSAEQFATIGAGLSDAIADRAYTCYACAILPDHAHLVIRKHRDRAEMMIETLQRATRLRLSSDQLIPRDHPCWTEGGWRGFLDTPTAVRSAIRYVEENPVKDGLSPQSWPFVVPYDNWPNRKPQSTTGS
jgi:REP element-mobilizing transposase RayT